MIERSFYWSLLEKGYLKLLQGAASAAWDLDSLEYEARKINQPPISSKPMKVRNFKN